MPGLVAYLTLRETTKDTRKEMTTPTPRHIDNSGSHTREVLAILGTEIDQAGIAAILAKSIEVLEQAIDPRGPAPPTDSPSDGLLYGLIQSGKTSIITVAAAMAADNGFQYVLILTSDNDPLYDQTVERVKKALRGLVVLGKNDWRDPQRFQVQLQNTPVVIVCSKNGSRLQALLDAFRTAKAKKLATLIIDDEADQASLNTRESRGAGEVSRINEVISALRAYFPTNTYLQVTATPQALFLQRPDGRYRPAFTVLSAPGDGYVGGEHFFGPNARLLREVDINEVTQLVAAHQPSPSGGMPPGLSRALHTFFIGAAARLIERPSDGFAFLCHVSVRTADHQYIVKVMDQFQQQTITALKAEGEAKYDRVVTNLKVAYDDLVQTEPSLPPFPDVLTKVKFYLPGASIKLINALSREEIQLESAFNIFVGGNKLGRGVTIRNLLVSYYGRNPKRPNSDTVLQHARMYGYRARDLGVTRLFLPPQLAEHFRLIHQMESALRDLVQKHPRGHFEGLYVSSPLQATRRNVLDPSSIGMYVAGGSYNPRRPLRTKGASQHTTWVDEQLEKFKDTVGSYEVDVSFIQKLLEHCPTDPQYPNEMWNLKTIGAALEKLRSLRGNKAYLVVRRGRALQEARRETQGILTGGEEALAPKNAPTLFVYRQNPTSNEVAAWWPQLRFPEGNYVLAFSFER